MKLIKQEAYEITESARLDWLTLNTYRPILLSKPGGKIRELDKLIILLSEHFKFERIGNNSESLCKSIYIKTSETNIQINFRGTFFALHGVSRFNFLRYIIAKLFLENHQCEEWQMKRDKLIPNWLITRVDVKRDIADKEWHEVLPIGDLAYKNMYHPKEKYTFFKCTATHYQVKNISTGISYSSSDKWQLNIYCKHLENKIQKNKIKRDMYEVALAGRKVIRVELRINGGQSNSYANWLIHNREDITEEIFCNEILNKWGKSHSVKKSQRKMEKRWNDFFCVGKKKKRNEYGKVEIKSQHPLEIAQRFTKAAVGKYIEKDLTCYQAMKLFRESFVQSKKDYKKALEILEGNKQTRSEPSSKGLCGGTNEDDEGEGAGPEARSARKPKEGRSEVRRGALPEATRASDDVA